MAEPSIFQPTPTWLGPGLTVHWQATFTGPLPVGSFATLELFGVLNEEVLWNIELVGDPDPRVGTRVIGLETDGSRIQWNASNQKTKDGDQVRLLYRLFNGSQVVLEQDEITLPLDSTVGLPKLLLDVENQIGAGGGFTAGDRAILDMSQAQTQVNIPVLGGFGELLSDLADWTTLSHGTILTRGPVQLLSGRGSLPVAPLAGRGLPFGAFFAWFTVPAGLGFTDGVVLHYTRSLFEIAPIYADGGLDEYRSDVREFHEDGVFLEWLGKIPPHRIDYWALPGIVVAWQFMYTKP